MKLFKVTEPDGSEVDMERIIREEEWASGLSDFRIHKAVWCIDDDGGLFLMDAINSYRYPPIDRFRIKWNFYIY